MPAADPDPPRPCHRENRTRKHPGRHRTKSQRPPPVSHSLPPRPNPSTLLPARGDQLPSCVSAPARYGLADRLVGKADLRKNACGRGGRTYQHRTTPVPGQSSSVTRLAVPSRGRTISRARRAHLTNAAGRPGHGRASGDQMEPLLLLVAAAVVLYAVVGHGADLGPALAIAAALTVFSLVLLSGRVASEQDAVSIVDAFFNPEELADKISEVYGFRVVLFALVAGAILGVIVGLIKNHAVEQFSSQPPTVQSSATQPPASTPRPALPPAIQPPASTARMASPPPTPPRSANPKPASPKPPESSIRWVMCSKCGHGFAVGDIRVALLP